MKRPNVSLVDCHVYGGLLVVAVSVSCWYAPIGGAALGLGLMYLGLRNPRNGA